MDNELLKVLAPYFTSILGAIVAISIAIFNNSSKSKAIQNKLSQVDEGTKAIQNKLSQTDEETKAIQSKLSQVDEGTKAIQNKLSQTDEETKAIQNKLSQVDEETKVIQNNLSQVDEELQELKKNHFFHLGKYLKKLNAFLHRGSLMDEVEKADMDLLADGVAGSK